MKIFSGAKSPIENARATRELKLPPPKESEFLRGAVKEGVYGLYVGAPKGPENEKRPDLASERKKDPKIKSVLGFAGTPESDGNKKDVLGGTGTHFSTPLILPGPFILCQVHT